MKRHIYLKYFFVFMFFLILSAGSTIPFFFESPSIFYKTGVDKFLLRSGKIIGIVVLLLMVTQLFLISKFRVLTDAFSMKTLFRLHRVNGLFLLVAAIIHPVLILGADHFVFFPIEFKYWPEFTGSLLLLLLLLFVCVSFWQKQLGLNYKTWQKFHKIGAPFLFVFLYVHIFNVSRSFESGLPFYALSIMCAITMVLIIRKLLKR